MSAVGDATRLAHNVLQSDTNVSESTLVWHDGGHFTDIPGRLAQAMLWLLR
jgi:hypothetical protein